MVALPPITATTNLPGYARPVPVSQPGPALDAARGAGARASIGGGAASSAIANQARQSLVEASKETAAGEPNSQKERARLPDPPFTQSVGLYVNSTRVFVDIVLNGDENRRVARVFGTPPAPPPPGKSAATRNPVNFVA